jgi:hypothetical protein
MTELDKIRGSSMNIDLDEYWRDAWIPAYTERLQFLRPSVTYLGRVVFGPDEGDQHSRIDVWAAPEYGEYRLERWEPDYSNGRTPLHDLDPGDESFGWGPKSAWGDILDLVCEEETHGWQFARWYLVEPEPWLIDLALAARGSAV